VFWQVLLYHEVRIGAGHSFRNGAQAKMIYFDNSATTLIKPPEVSEAVSYAINNFGNAGRSFYDPVITANREIYKTRAEIANLIGLDDPLAVAFTSSATESLNLVIGGLIGASDSVISTVTEHNSVLRPLYLTGCDISFMDCDENGCLDIESFEKLLKPATRFLVCTHGSNVTGNLTPARRLYELCKVHNITMILDISQTFGSSEVNINMADIFCFTGHKALFGPQGTGGIIAGGGQEFRIVKTGGAGVNSFDRFQTSEMPDIFETGTPNCHGIYGLQKGVSFINKTGIEAIEKKEAELLRTFIDGISCGSVRFYGDVSTENRLPVISISIEGMTSSEFAERLWSDYGIATRAGSHCAPLLHKKFGTVDTGMVRFSFSYFNTIDEVKICTQAIKEILESAGR